MFNLVGHVREKLLGWKPEASGVCGLAQKLLAAGVCLFLLPQVAAAASMTAQLDRETAAVGESVTLTLTFEGVTPNAPPNLPALPNVQASFSGQSSSFSFVNG